MNSSCKTNFLIAEFHFHVTESVPGKKRVDDTYWTKLAVEGYGIIIWRCEKLDYNK